MGEVVQKFSHALPESGWSIGVLTPCSWAVERPTAVLDIGLAALNHCSINIKIYGRVVYVRFEVLLPAFCSFPFWHQLVTQSVSANDRAELLRA